MSFRLIVHPKMDGRLAMAFDEVLVGEVGEGGSAPTIRLYGFSPPTLSVGRFQSVKDGLDAERMKKDGVCLVRRPTGGHAVFHDDELTYSVALRKVELDGTLGSHRKRAVYEYIASMLLEGLGALGISALVNSRQIGDPHNPDCFGSSGEYEITGRSGRKLIGSAQMTTRNAVLQQGSIPISSLRGRALRYLAHAGSADEGEPSSLSEEAGRSLGFEEVRDAFAEALRRRFNAEDSPTTDGEEAAARLLLAEKYATDAWNLRS